MLGLRLMNAHMMFSINILAISEKKLFISPKLPREFKVARLSLLNFILPERALTAVGKKNKMAPVEHINRIFSTNLNKKIFSILIANN